MKYALAIDIGASSGRHIVGWEEGGEIKTKEVYRFPNGVTERDGHLVWDIDALVQSVKDGITEAKREFPEPASLSVDTWGVDYVLMNGDTEILPVYAYRDSRTEAVIPDVHEKIPFSELYRRTGCQFQPFNSIYQLYSDLQSGRLEGVTDFLMIPEYLMYRLCGVKAKEYTNATTTGLVNAAIYEFDNDIISQLRLPPGLFPRLHRPGEIIGEYEGIKVMLCATHDTGSAVEGIPMADDDLYLSSGTWSLLGVKLPSPLTNEDSEKANYSNEGGVGYTRYQKNIMGMWLINELRRELCPGMDFATVVSLAEASSFNEMLDADSPELLSPRSMKAAFDSLLGSEPANIGDYFRCAYLSLAASYAKAIRELEGNTGRQYKRLCIVGGGAKNAFLNRLTAEATGKEVIPLPIEATAIGNLKIQLEA